MRGLQPECGGCGILRGMKAHQALTPVLNVSDIAATFAWFEKWGWKKLFECGTPPTFGGVGSGECEIFLCQGCQGSRGKGSNAATFGAGGDEIGVLVAGRGAAAGRKEFVEAVLIDEAAGSGVAFDAMDGGGLRHEGIIRRAVRGVNRMRGAGRCEGFSQSAAAVVSFAA